MADNINIVVSGGDDMTGKLNEMSVNSTPASKPYSTEKRILEEVNPIAIPPSVADEIQQKTKKKKSKKSKSKTNRLGSGFEPGYADAPLTPEDAILESTELYAPSADFAARIETCIQRYRARRRMGSVQADIFTQYIKFGGISTGQKQFGGGTNFDDPDLDTKDIRNATATDFVDGDKFDLAGGEGKWVVDWTGIIKAFLGDFAPDRWDPEKVSMTTITDLLRNFIRYVRYHNVCPEYEEDMQAALEVCNVADEESPQIDRVTTLVFVSLFNKAMSTYYGGFQRTFWDNNEDFRDGNDPLYQTGMPKEAGERILKAVMPPSVDITTPTLKNVKCTLLEILEIIIPSSEGDGPENAPNDSTPAEEPAAPAIGRFLALDLGAYPCTPAEDLTPSEQAEAARQAAHPLTYSLPMEVTALRELRPGVKIWAEIGTLSNGTQWLDRVIAVRPSYWAWAANAELQSWKEPREWDKGYETRLEMEDDVVDGDAMVGKQGEEEGAVAQVEGERMVTFE
ncbi:MAG: hypothetical protein M1814_000213 [Vezdaea aestivalis]|nr:MAG: hypothetical protein M1814_000213 [Vezdaea aestivalis]